MSKFLPPPTNETRVLLEQATKEFEGLSITDEHIERYSRSVHYWQFMHSWSEASELGGDRNRAFRLDAVTKFRFLQCVSGLNKLDRQCRIIFIYKYIVTMMPIISDNLFQEVVIFSNKNGIVFDENNLKALFRALEEDLRVLSSDLIAAEFSELISLLRNCRSRRI